MNQSDRAGTYMNGAAGEAYKVFIPRPLPPI
jgi:hypothetical protein